MMHGLVSVIIPTAGRLSWRKAVQSLYDTTENFPVECIISVDGDDRLKRSFEYSPAGDSEWRSRDYWEELVIHNYRGGALNGWNEGLAASRGEFIVMGADDLVFRESWLSEALKCLRGQTGGVGCVGFNDLHNGERHQTHFLMHRSFIIKHLGGVLVPPVYRHYQVDTEIIRRADAEVLYGYAEDSIVEHYHPANAKRPIDKWDEATRPKMAEDTNTFFQRQELGFPSNYEPVIRE